MTASHTSPDGEKLSTLMTFERNLDKHSKFTKEDEISQEKFMMSNEFENNHYTPKVVSNLINFQENNSPVNQPHINEKTKL